MGRPPSVAERPLVDLAVTCVSAGLAIVGLGVERPAPRAFLVLFAMALLAAFLLGGPEFARLVS